ncbi:hypothetical protein BH11MYX2_BH11MYX2_00230 [soil metagenome]
MADPFTSRRLGATTSFDELVASVHFDGVAEGRRGAVIVKPEARGVPIVRTTTAYATPAQHFRGVHDELAHLVGHPFNNALVEHYTPAYAKMKAHSDQALDLADDSVIAVYSCYRDAALPSRRLVIEPKESGVSFEVPLDHDSVVMFSLATNRRFRHAILLRPQAPDNEWFGITFRASKTFVQFVANQPRVEGEPLTLANEDQRREFFHYRSRENNETSFAYPEITYTLSESDRLPPR